MFRPSYLLLVPLLAIHAEVGSSVEAFTGYGVDFAVPRSHHPANGLDGLAASDRSTGPLLGLGVECGWTLPNETHVGLAANYIARMSSWDLDASQIVIESANDSVKHELQEDGSETVQFIGAGPCVALIGRKWVGFRIVAEFGGVHASFRDHWESRDSGRAPPLRSSDRSGSGWHPGYMLGMDLDKPFKRGTGLRLGLRYSSVLGHFSNGSDPWSAPSRGFQRFDAVLGGYIQF
jgi:hypothetical protein